MVDCEGSDELCQRCVRRRRGKSTPGWRVDAQPRKPGYAGNDAVQSTRQDLSFYGRPSVHHVRDESAGQIEGYSTDNPGYALRWIN